MICSVGKGEHTMCSQKIKVFLDHIVFTIILPNSSTDNYAGFSQRFLNILRTVVFSDIKFRSTSVNFLGKQIMKRCRDDLVCSEG